MTAHSTAHSTGWTVHLVMPATETQCEMCGSVVAAFRQTREDGRERRAWWETRATSATGKPCMTEHTPERCASARAAALVTAP